MSGRTTGRVWAGLPALVGIALAVTSLAAAALGLGDIDLRSRLGEPLDARIALVAVREGDVDTLRAAGATRDAYVAAGLERHRALAGLEVEVVGGARPHLRVRTRDGIREPALDLVVDARWQGGTLRRRYVLLFGPRSE